MEDVLRQLEAGTDRSAFLAMVQSGGGRKQLATEVTVGVTEWFQRAEPVGLSPDDRDWITLEVLRRFFPPLH